MTLGLHGPTTATLTERLRIAAERTCTGAGGNQRGPFGSPGCASNALNHAEIAAGLRQYVTGSLVVLGPVIGHLLDGEDYAEAMDACNELPCGHLPIDACSCRKKETNPSH